MTLDAVLADDDAAKAITSDLEQAKDEQAQRHAAYDDELAYAALVDEMRTRSDDELLALLAADGAISAQLATVEAEMAVSLGAVEQAQRHVVAVRKTIGAIENLYTRKAVELLAERADQILTEIRTMPQDQLLPEDRSNVNLQELRAGVPVSEEPQATAGGVASEVVRQQARLAKEQAFAGDMRGYFTRLEEANAALRAALGELDAGVSRHTEQLSAWVYQEKRRYACARELQGRVEDGRLARRRAPRGLYSWVTRRHVQTARSRLVEFTRRYDTMRTRWTTVLQRREKIVSWKPWIDIRATAADAKMEVIGQPVAHLSVARIPLGELPEYRRQALQYQAEARLSDAMDLAITVLRDLEGVVHYVPNGTVNRVSNMTQEWSRIVLDVRVSYTENVDRVHQVVRDVLLEMRTAPPWSWTIVEPPTVAGVQAFRDNAIDIRVMIKTRPGKQWETAREVRRRIKQRFDDEGIEMPLPQRVVHHVHGDEHVTALDEETAGREDG